VNVAWKIHHHKLNKAFDPMASLRAAGGEPSKLANTAPFGPAQTFGSSVNPAVAGQGSALHAQS